MISLYIYGKLSHFIGSILIDSKYIVASIYFGIGAVGILSVTGAIVYSIGALATDSLSWGIN